MQLPLLENCWKVAVVMSTGSVWFCVILCIRLYKLALKKYSHSEKIPTIGFNYVKMLINFQIRASTFSSKAIMQFFIMSIKADGDEHLLNIWLIQHYINRFFCMNFLCYEMAHGIQITLCTYSNLTKIPDKNQNLRAQML